MAPQKYMLKENPFVLYKRKDSTDYYLSGWVRYREEVRLLMRLIVRHRKVSPECNYIPSEEPIPEEPGRNSQVNRVLRLSGVSRREEDLKEKSSRAINTGECEIYEIGPMPRMVCSRYNRRIYRNGEEP